MTSLSSLSTSPGRCQEPGRWTLTFLSIFVLKNGIPNLYQSLTVRGQIEKMISMLYSVEVEKTLVVAIVVLDKAQAQEVQDAVAMVDFRLARSGLCGTPT